MGAETQTFSKAQAQIVNETWELYTKDSAGNGLLFFSKKQWLDEFKKKDGVSLMKYLVEEPEFAEIFFLSEKICKLLSLQIFSLRKTRIVQLIHQVD
ncbi:hypothetical protein R1sor_026360 [Riccia sorocarpa]|uniref:Uncharacterized protein n=1 Tax=Riccia sorocarpa TaxID=122646 RepID=A0ABD3GB69_9MARC